MTAALGAPMVRTSPRRVRPVLNVLRGPDALERLLEGAASRATPFQSDVWLRAWYRHLCTGPGVTPFLVVARDARVAGVHGHIAAWPLVRRRRYGLPGVEFADRGVTDVNASLPGPAFDPEMAGAPLLDALTIAARPFARLRVARVTGEDPICGAALAVEEVRHVVPLSQGLDVHLGAKKCKALRRQIRILGGTGQSTSLRMAETQAERDTLLDLVHASQVRRHAGRGFLLDRPAYQAFYADLAGPGAVSLVRMAGLWLGDTPIAGAMLLADARTCTVVRLGMAGDPAIVRASPGRLLVRALAHWAARQGYAVLDLSIGGNDLKTWFRCEPRPLHGTARFANGLWDRR